MRFEIKIPITEDNLLLFYNWRDNIRGLKKIYKDRVVNSIYYDEKNLTFANDNLIGISERLKTRLRWYNTDKNFFYEFKSKKNKIGKKIIIPSNKTFKEISLINLFSYKNVDFKSKKLEEKIMHIVTRYDLLPILKFVWLFCIKLPLQMSELYSIKLKLQLSFKMIKFLLLTILLLILSEKQL